MSRLVVHDHEGVDKNHDRNRKYQGYHEETIDRLNSVRREPQGLHVPK